MCNERLQLGELPLQGSDLRIAWHDLVEHRAVFFEIFVANPRTTLSIIVFYCFSWFFKELDFKELENPSIFIDGHPSLNINGFPSMDINGFLDFHQ